MVHRITYGIIRMYNSCSEHRTDNFWENKLCSMFPSLQNVIKYEKSTCELILCLFVKKNIVLIYGKKQSVF